MDNFDPVRLPERNPVTTIVHRREVLWQITVPLIVGAVVVLALMVFSVFGSDTGVRRWADISLVWVLIPTCFFSLIFLALLGGITYLVIVIIRKLPPLMRRLQDLIASLGATVRMITDKIAEPILRIQSFSASVDAFRKGVRREVRRPARRP